MTDSVGYEGIAIVGMAGRFPKAHNLDEFWDNLVAGRECLTEFSEDEIVASGVPRASLSEERRRTRGVLDGATDFDARFFGYTPREAEVMDPQQRVFLEVAWQALEDAGYDSERPPGAVGVYAGSGINTYYEGHVATRPDILSTFGRFPAVVLNEKDFISTRVAYAMDLRGPALTVQTACSSALVAVCYAAQGLLNFECDMAIAGASAAVFPQTHSFIHEEGGMISRDGHCRPFSADASGTLFSDGAGAVVLRRLSDAIEDGDTIRAVIRGFAVNNDGATKAGFSAPSVDGQAEVIQLAQGLGGISPDTVSYIEAHGTATPLGDPIEVAALTKAFRQDSDRTGFCGLGSVKSNIGHLDAAAGIAGLIKTTLALEHRQLPATLNFNEPSPHVDWEASPFYVVDRLTAWEAGETPRRAGVSSFGIGGTNSHVVLEEAPAPRQRPDQSRRPQLVTLSAKTHAALEQATANLADHLAGSRDELADIAFTLQLGRREFQHRRAVVVSDRPGARDALASPNDRQVLTGQTHHRRKPVVFMFSGQGSQYVDMARGLYDDEPEFRATFDRCAELLEPMLGFDIRGVIYPTPPDRESASETLKQTANTQPALFAIEYSLATLWQARGVHPAAMVGHSIGEYSAACVAGVFTLEGALRLVAERGRLMQSMPGGAMLAVPLTESDVEPMLDTRSNVSVINSEGMVVVSGEFEAIDELEAALAERGVQAHRVQTSHAFHSHMMEPILDEFREQVARAQPQAPRIPIASNLTGTWMTAEQATDPDYWAQHLRQPVRFRDCLTTLLKEPDRAFLEVGPGRVLVSLTRMHADKARETDVVASLRHADEVRLDDEFLLESLGRLWLAGVSIDWHGLHDAGQRMRVPLPTYPFERQRYLLEPGVPGGHSAPTSVTAIAPELTLEHGTSPRVTDPATDDGLDDVERMIATTWEDLLGVGHVGRDESFFDLGGTSLLAARMFVLLARHTGTRLPLSTLIDAPTVGLLADVVREGVPETPSVVQIQRGDGSRPPLFLIHAEGGQVLIYRELAEALGSDWTVFGIQSKGLDGVSTPSDSIEEMAAQYVADVREVQPSGPYYLGGWCLGGTIGYQMARQLMAEGEHVAWLGMIQARHTSYWDARTEASPMRRMGWNAADRLAFESDLLSGLKGSEKLKYVTGKARRAVVRTWAKAPVGGQRSPAVEEHAIANACSRAHNDAYWAYETKPYDGRVALVRSTNQPRGVRPDPTLGWGESLGGEVELYEVDAFHSTIVRDAQATIVADILRASIDAATAAGIDRSD